LIHDVLLALSDHVLSLHIRKKRIKQSPADLDSGNERAPNNNNRNRSTERLSVSVERKNVKSYNSSNDEEGGVDRLVDAREKILAKLKRKTFDEDIEVKKAPVRSKADEIRGRLGPRPLPEQQQGTSSANKGKGRGRASSSSSSSSEEERKLTTLASGKKSNRESDSEVRDKKKGDIYKSKSSVNIFTPKQMETNRREGGKPSFEGEGVSKKKLKGEDRVGTKGKGRRSASEGSPSRSRSSSTEKLKKELLKSSKQATIERDARKARLESGERDSSVGSSTQDEKGNGKSKNEIVKESSSVSPVRRRSGQSPSKRRRTSSKKRGSKSVSRPMSARSRMKRRSRSHEGDALNARGKRGSRSPDRRDSTSAQKRASRSADRDRSKLPNVRRTSVKGKVDRK